MTAYARAYDRSQALGAGCEAHLAKPIDPGELLRKLGELLGRPAPATA